MPWHADALPVYISFKDEGKWSDPSTWMLPTNPRVPVSAACNDACLFQTLAPENAKKACEEASDHADACQGVHACLCSGVVYLYA